MERMFTLDLSLHTTLSVSPEIAIFIFLGGRHHHAMRSEGVVCS